MQQGPSCVWRRRSPDTDSRRHRRHDRPGRCRGRPDRKSTRLNSSHLVISYAVFCLKKNVDVTALLPTDDMSHGFDTMADVRPVSPALIAADSRAAGKISREAVFFFKCLGHPGDYPFPPTAPPSD